MTTPVLINLKVAQIKFIDDYFLMVEVVGKREFEGKPTRTQTSKSKNKAEMTLQ